MNIPHVAAVMVHVGSVSEALAWYSCAFPGAVRSQVSEPEFEFLQLSHTRLEFVPADSKVSSGAAGSVVYWQVPEFEAALVHFQSIGARLYRGPMKIEAGQCMCQVQDPWGNCIDLRGPSSQALSVQ